MGTEIAFAIALIVAVTVIFWIILKNSSEKIIAQFRLISEKRSLELDVPEPKLFGFMRSEPAAYGTYRNRELSLTVPGKGLQNTRQIETVLKVELKDKTLRAQFTRAGLIGHFKQRDSGGMARWKSGNTDFDEVIDVRSNQSERLHMLLDQKTLTWIATTLKIAKGSLYFGNGTLVYTELGLISNDASRQRFEQVLEFLCDFAESVEHKN
jgi:hypothetical protein